MSLHNEANFLVEFEKSFLESKAIEIFCEVYNKTFPSIEKVSEHKKKYHSIGWKYSCVHQRVHSGEKSFSYIFFLNVLY